MNIKTALQKQREMSDPNYAVFSAIQEIKSKIDEMMIEYVAKMGKMMDKKLAEQKNK